MTIPVRTLLNTLLLSLFIFTSCKEQPEPAGRHTFTFSGMGTVLSVTYIGDRQPAAEKAVRTFVKRFEKEASFHNPDSFVSLLNRKAGEKPVTVPPYLCRLVRDSILFWKETAGAFDITYRTEGKLWARNSSKPPSEKEIAELLPLVGSSNITADCAANTVRFAHNRLVIDLGGIAKGYAIAETGRILNHHGISDFIVDFGGDLLVCGQKPDGRWTVAIRNPDNPDKFLHRFSAGGTSCESITTSGDYERFVEIDGQRYSHIIDPRSGRPVKHARSVTVRGHDPVIADMLATAISVRHDNADFIQKIVDKFTVNVYTLTGKEAKWREYGK